MSRIRGFTLNFEGFRTPITGHIDFVQIRNGLIHILDYKPGAEKTDAVEQLTIYAHALASRTKLAVKDFKCAWFDDSDYYEFFPLHAVYAKK
ncbi:MAG: PD-(D/E)XK nuclease family protein [Candidatus Aenigmarchaeota archaeon]|nr:PD-(D/E)XK nuclease family protein [Candidatus Aenigmarchaeota archaeon]